jgi:hypothetical protein
MIIMLLGMVATIYVLNFFFDMYYKKKGNKRLDMQQQIDILKVFTKNELYKKENYEEFIKDFLNLKRWSGYVETSLWNKEVSESDV